MKKPDELIELLETLRESGDDTTVTLGPEAEAIVYIGKNEMKLPSRDCVLLLTNEESVDSFFDSIGQPEGARIELHDMDIDQDVLDALSERFATVDET
jgi:hypothetical protein